MEEEYCDECEPDLSTIDLDKIAPPTRDVPSLLILITHGTYGYIDDVLGSIYVGNAAIAKQQKATIILMGDGVYCAVKHQNPEDIHLPNNLEIISDFLELQGTLYALKSSLEKRGLSIEDLIDGVKLIENRELVKEIENHNLILTF
ncbi:MAG: DsrH/TusB family sulfur metabolism protein [Candidatus Hydrothermarchaeota archaeon]